MAQFLSFLPTYNGFTLLCVFLVTFLLCVDFMKRRKKWALYPPGPYSMPFLGNMLQVDFKNITTSFDKFRKKYGDVFSLQICWTNVVVLNGFEVMKEALFLKSEDISDRPPFPIFDHVGFKGNSQDSTQIKDPAGPATQHLAMDWTKTPFQKPAAHHQCNNCEIIDDV